MEPETLTQEVARAAAGGIAVAIHAIGEEIADQQIRHRAAEVRIFADEFAEAEPVVVLAHQTSHPIDALIEERAPLSELRR